MKILFTLLLAASLTGCAFHRTPYVMFEGSPPLSETAVFAAFDNKVTKFNDPRIRMVDGKDTSCAQAGCPFWVRVKPGKHVFDVRYSTNFRLSGYNFADASLIVEDMKPRHVYVVRYVESGGGVRITVEDLGESVRRQLEMPAH